MEWNEVEVQASPAQRRGLYKFLVGADPEELRDLIRSLTFDEASAMLDALVGAERRSRVLVA